ncbi:MAG: pseudouridine synthase [Limisphaerales bacterium]
MPIPTTIDLPRFPPIRILHDDPNYLAIDKPAGALCTLAGSNSTSPALDAALELSVVRGDSWAKERGLKILRLAQVLEPATSGILLFSRSVGNRLDLARVLEDRRTLREFLAVVGGKPPRRRWTCCLKIRPDPARPDRVLTHPSQGLFAETVFEVIGHGDGMALVLARIRTDRQHQIRAHLAASGVPILGDTLYGFGRSASRGQPGALPAADSRPTRGHPSELALRAVRLAFVCPITREPVDIQAPISEFLATYGFDAADENDAHGTDEIPEGTD